MTAKKERSRRALWTMGFGTILASALVAAAMIATPAPWLSICVIPIGFIFIQFWIVPQILRQK